MKHVESTEALNCLLLPLLCIILSIGIVSLVRSQVCIEQVEHKVAVKSELNT